MTKIKNYLISIVAISLFLLLAVASSDSSDSTPTYSPQSNVDQWYVGGTLHSSSIAEWKNATEKNKLATCADIVANVKKFNLGIRFVHIKKYHY